MTLSALLFFSNATISLDATILGNTMLQYIYAISAFIVLSLVFKLVQFMVLRKLSKLAQETETDIDDTIIKVFKSLRPSFYYFIAFYFAMKFLTLSALANSVINGALVAWVVYQVIIASQILVDYILHKRFISDEKDEGTKAAIKYVGNFVKGAVWALGILLVLSNLGVNITSLIAGLGIGGVAIAFALQSILGDLFSSFAIYFDKPFQVGEFIVIGNNSGTVEKIGIKSTRLRALSGEELIISNKELTTARIQNYRRLKERRAVFALGVLYETPYDKVKQIPTMIKDIIDKKEKARFDRAHFKNFGDSALEFEIVYHVLSNAYDDYMDTHQSINLAILEKFEKEGIGFAYPTQTIYIQK